MENILPEIVNMNQIGSILSCQNYDNIRRSLQIIRHINQNKIQAMLISLDAEKAIGCVQY